MIQDLLASLRIALGQFATSLARFLPRLLVALALLVLGWLLAVVLRAITRRVLSWLRFDQLVERVTGTELSKRVGVGAPHALVGSAVYWLTWVAVLIAMMKALDVSGIEALLQDFVRYLPSLAVALLVLVIGVALSSLAWRIALLAAVNARFYSAKLLASLVRVLVLVASVAMAFGQLGIGSGVLHTAFAIVFGAVMLAAAIAFGLGGRHAARKFLEERLLARGKKEDDASHL